MNCDSANARRLAVASLRQRGLVEKLDELGLLAGADPRLLEFCEARLRNPQASLAELGRMFDPPVSKAVVQGRIRRLEAMMPGEEDRC